MVYVYLGGVQVVCAVVAGFGAGRGSLVIGATGFIKQSAIELIQSAALLKPATVALKVPQCRGRKALFVWLGFLEGLPP